ncbi:hypothetical protein AGMMS50239_06310 [Bacteroidia bacterium]|nr:hypothetical protein AGMMS50239_06310 [Bacteroidia bacterium]
MQKKYLKRTILLFLLAGIIFACVYDDDSIQFSKESFMEEAQKWYDGNRGNPIDAQFVEESPEVLIKPEWKYPYVQRKEEYATLEYNYLYQTCYDTGSGDYGNGYGGGGGDGNNSIPKTIEPRTDCPNSAGENSTNVINIMNNTGTDYQKIQPLIKELKNFAIMSSNEYGLAVNYGTGQYLCI